MSLYPHALPYHWNKMFKPLQYTSLHVQGFYIGPGSPEGHIASASTGPSVSFGPKCFKCAS